MNWENANINELTAKLPGVNTLWLKELRAEQWQRFLENGWPTRRNEAWKYTDINLLAQQQLLDFLRLGAFEALSPEKTIVINEGNDAPRIDLTFVNGRLLNKPAHLPSGVVVTDLQTALQTHPEWVERGLSQYQESPAGFVNFNTSLWENGLFILVPDHVVLDKPIIVRYVTEAPEPQWLVLRNMIFVGHNSQLTLFQDFSGHDAAAYWQSSINQIDLAEQAKLNLVKCQREGQSATHLIENWVRQAGHSALNASSFSLGAKLQREAWHVDLAGSKARCQCHGLAIVNDSQHSDYHLTIDHQAPECVSQQIFRSIASGKSRAIFNGKVIVQPEGQKAVADQLSQNLLLSSSAEIDTRPELEIYADEVKCTHGASVGQLDPEALFYLQSRGISHEMAKGMLLQAFVQDQLELVHPLIQHIIAPILDDQLAIINGVNCR